LTKAADRRTRKTLGKTSGKTLGKRRRSRNEEPPGEGGPDEAAAFIAETSAELVALARRHGLDMLGFLLDMVQMDAREHLHLRSKRKLS
jgi:hypothetical protein